MKPDETELPLEVSSGAIGTDPGSVTVLIIFFFNKSKKLKKIWYTFLQSLSVKSQGAILPAIYRFTAFLSPTF